MLRNAFLSAAALTLLLCTSLAQTPQLTVVQAAPAPVTANASQTGAPEQPVSFEAAFKLLQAMRAANQAILAKQAATLQQLEEMEKTAEQIKIYTKRT